MKFIIIFIAIFSTTIWSTEESESGQASLGPFTVEEVDCEAFTNKIELHYSEARVMFSNQEITSEVMHKIECKLVTEVRELSLFCPDTFIIKSNVCFIDDLLENKYSVAPFNDLLNRDYYQQVQGVQRDGNPGYMAKEIRAIIEEAEEDQE